jgi:hypothetical protein
MARLDLFLTALAPAIWGSSYIVTTSLLPGQSPLLVDPKAAGAGGAQLLAVLDPALCLRLSAPGGRGGNAGCGAAIVGGVFLGLCPANANSARRPAGCRAQHRWRRPAGADPGGSS